MTEFDYAVFVIVGFSLIVGILRGVMRELVMLVGWISAFVLAMAYTGDLAQLMPHSMGPMLAPLIAYLAIFVGVLVVAGFIGLVLAMLARSAGLGLLDRMLGAAFGAVRGLLVVLAGVMLAGLTPLPREPFWEKAVFSGPFETLVMVLRPYLPPDLGRRIKYR
jgi:membrane protein required for colicin V production